jgi:hypothetical protein
VDGSGLRFVDEGLDDVRLSIAAARHGDAQRFRSQNKFKIAEAAHF